MKIILKRTYCIIMVEFLCKIKDTLNLIRLISLRFKQINYICNIILTPDSQNQKLRIVSESGEVVYKYGGHVYAQNQVTK